MIGNGYWATGLKIEHHGGGQWTASVEFFDDGFCEDDATQGKLYTRYQVGDIDRAIDVLLLDMKRLGVVSNEGVGEPTIYVYQDGEDEARDDNELLIETAIAQCERLGWPTLYKRERASG